MIYYCIAGKSYLNSNQSLFLFLLSSATTESGNLDNDDDEDKENSENNSQNIQQEVLSPVEVVSVRSHVSVVRMSEEILQPPD